MKLIMVDLDGTLFDTKEVNYLAYKEAIKPYGYTIDYDYYCEFCNGRHYLDFLPQITTMDKRILKDMHDRKKKAYSKFLNKAVVNERLLDMLVNCKGDYKIALVTTASKRNTDEILGYFRIRELFDLIITHDDITKPKPNPEGFMKAMSFYNAMPEECIIFEDSAVGIDAARKTGATVFVAEGFN